MSVASVFPQLEQLLPRPATAVLAVLFGAGAATLTLYCLHVVMRTEAVWPAENSVTLRFGTNLPMSTRSVMPAISMVSASKALIATGTS